MGAGQWEVATGKNIWPNLGDYSRYVDHSSPVVFSPDEQYILFGSNNSVKILEVATGEETQRFQGHSGKVNSVAFSPNGQLALSGSDDKMLILWEVATGKRVRKATDS